jgi:hypothetical protein
MCSLLCTAILLMYVVGAVLSGMMFMDLVLVLRTDPMMFGEGAAGVFYVLGNKTLCTVSHEASCQHKTTSQLWDECCSDLPSVCNSHEFLPLGSNLPRSCRAYRTQMELLSLLFLWVAYCLSCCYQSMKEKGPLKPRSGYEQVPLLADVENTIEIRFNKIAERQEDLGIAIKEHFEIQLSEAFRKERLDRTKSIEKLQRSLAEAVVELKQHREWQLPRRFSDSSSSTTSDNPGSSGSLNTCEPRCYLPNTAFKCPSGELILVQDIKQDQELVAFNSDSMSIITRVVKVTKYPKHTRHPFTIVIIKTAQGSFLLSESHCVPVKINEQVVSRQASELTSGEFVQVGSKWLPVLNKLEQRKKLDLFMITTANPCALEAFPIPVYGLHTFTDYTVDLAEDLVGENTTQQQPRADVSATDLLHLIGCSNVSVQDLTNASPSSYED